MSKCPHCGEDLNSPPETMEKPKIALCIGHSRRGEKGAKSSQGDFEWDYWNRWAAQFKSKHESLNLVIVNDYARESYTDAMSWLASRLRTIEADYAIELHFNAYNREAEGFEALYWKGSKNGLALAKKLTKEQGDKFPARVGRGVKGLDEWGRGGQFLRKTHCPAVIWEPFFGDNPMEDEFYRDNSSALMEVLASVLESLP